MTMTTKWEVLLPAAIDPAGPESLADIAHCTGMDEYENTDAALADIGRYDAVVCRTARLDAEVLDRADRLRVIAKHGTGLDTVDVDAASRRGVVVCNTPDANTQSVAEHTLALLFGVRRHLHVADRHEIAALGAVLEHHGRAAVQDARGEDRQHAGIGVG